MFENRTFMRVVGLGFVCGLRTMMGAALLARYLKEHPRQEWPHPLLRWLGQEPGVSLLQLFAGGELIADKLPFVPARTDPFPLASRAASGAAVGAALSALHDESPWAGAALGGAAAVVGATAGYHARRLLAGQNGLPDLVVALLEDALAVGVGRTMLAE